MDGKLRDKDDEEVNIVALETAQANNKREGSIRDQGESTSSNTWIIVKFVFFLTPPLKVFYIILS